MWSPLKKDKIKVVDDILKDVIKESENTACLDDIITNLKEISEDLQDLRENFYARPLNTQTYKKLDSVQKNVQFLLNHLKTKVDIK